jgi:cell division protein ZapE
LEFPFQRTTSRMLEMQSHDYLAREHKADWFLNYTELKN